MVVFQGQNHLKLLPASAAAAPFGVTAGGAPIFVALTAHESEHRHFGKYAIFAES